METNKEENDAVRRKPTVHSGRNSIRSCKRSNGWTILVHFSPACGIDIGVVLRIMDMQLSRVDTNDRTFPKLSVLVLIVLVRLGG